MIFCQIIKILLIFVGSSSSLLALSAEKPKVVALKVEPQSVADELFYPARIAAHRTVGIPAEIDGFVQSLSVSLGQSVKAGQTLLGISNPDPVYDYKAYSIKAPFSGIISSVETAVGDRVARGKQLLTLADSQSLKILIHLTSDDVRKLHPGFPGQLLIGADPVAVRIKAMSPIIDPASGTAPCELELLDPKQNKDLLVAGSIAKVRFALNQRQALLLPERSIVYRGRDPFVIRIAEGQRARYLPVTILKQNRGLFEVRIKDGIPAGSQIVASSQGFIQEGEELQLESTTAVTP